jgi:hypothetical protein
MGCGSWPAFAGLLIWPNLRLWDGGRAALVEICQRLGRNKHAGKAPDLVKAEAIPAGVQTGRRKVRRLEAPPFAWIHRPKNSAAQTSPNRCFDREEVRAGEKAQIAPMRAGCASLVAMLIGVAGISECLFAAFSLTAQARSGVKIREAQTRDVQGLRLPSRSPNLSALRNSAVKEEC